jgi:glycosyltransferase involved in cell wall biosynthesis
MKDGDPLISVIICTRNRKALVRRSIDSVLAQESVKKEIVVVDDCSDDGTFEFLQEHYGDEITTLRLPENRRVAFATNRGFERSRGQYIALLGDDDYWTDTCKLKKQLALFNDSSAELGLVGTWWSEINHSGQVLKRNPDEPINWSERLLLGGGIICGSTPLIRRSAWVDAGGMDERMPRGTDSDLFRRIILAGYSGKIIRQDTTVVDIGHQYSRMTSAGGIVEAKRKVFAHSYLLWKYRWHYLHHPKAMFVRIRRLLISPARAIFR